MALVRLLPIEPKVPFMGMRRITLTFSTVLVLLSVAVFAIQGLNLGVDFRGGILMEIKTEGPADISALRDRLSGLGLGEVTLQEFGAPDDVLINVQRQDGGDEAQQGAVTAIRDALGSAVAEYRRTELVGPKVSAELIEAGILATVLALTAIGLYIWFRFEWQFAVAAIAALVHDVISTIGFFALTQIEFNLATVAAILTIAGYSINDTVVVFDRVREELRRFKKRTIPSVLDLALCRTLSRTTLTSFTTLLALISLVVFGGEVIRGFSAALIWGVVIGTYSSLGLATPLLLALGLRRPSDPAPEAAAEKAG